MLDEEAAFSSSQAIKVSRVNSFSAVLEPDPADEAGVLEAAAGVETTGVAETALFWTAAEEAAGALVAVGVEAAEEAAPEDDELEPELAPLKRAGPGIW